MQSLTYENTASHRDAPTQRQLLVIWQNPQSRALLVVGRLAYDGQRYTFGYTRGSNTAFEAGFRGLPGLRDHQKQYTATDLFPVFAQRTLDSTRSDYEGYLEQLGLHGEVTPLEQIIHSGGRRTADTIQLIEIPAFDAGRIRSTFLASGVRHIPQPDKILKFTDGNETVSGDEHERALRLLQTGERLGHRHESQNPGHPDATVLTSPNGTPLGYVPDFLVKGIRHLLDASDHVAFTVLKTNGPEAPPHLRLLVGLDAETRGPNPFAVQEWEFIGDQREQ